MAYFNALLQHQGPLKHVGHAHRVATKPTPNVAPTGVGGFSMDQDGVRYDGGGFLTMGMEPERTPEEEKLIVERVLEMANMEIEYILATGRAYEALNAQYSRIAANNGGQMSDQLGNKWSYHLQEINRLAARLPTARLEKAKAEAQLSRMIHGLP
jgi:hypothetical protein